MWITSRNNGGTDMRSWAGLVLATAMALIGLPADKMLTMKNAGGTFTWTRPR